MTGAVSVAKISERPPSSSRRVLAALLGRLAAGCRGVQLAALILTNWFSSLRRRLLFQPRASDIYIASFPRSGTTWLQMVLYQLTTSGEMDFEHISEVSPYFERSLYRDRDLSHLASPRLFKTHWRWEKFSRTPGRFIYVARDGMDVLVSFYEFNRSHEGYERPFDQFADDFIEGRTLGGSWFEHVRSWRAAADQGSVLWLTYDELAQDLPGAIRRIAAHCDMPLDPETEARVLARCSFDFMKAHEARFDHLTEQLLEQGLRPGRFLRRGHGGQGASALSPAQQERFRDALQRYGLAARSPAPSSDFVDAA